jgi:hypothetical protein
LKITLPPRTKRILGLVLIFAASLIQTQGWFAEPHVVLASKTLSPVLGMDVHGLLIYAGTVLSGFGVVDNAIRGKVDGFLQAVFSAAPKQG